jgi:hypothetical protein
MLTACIGSTVRGFALVCCAILVLSPAAAHQSGTSQTSDEGWAPVIAAPQFPRGEGPLVLVDAAHGNFHTIEGRFSAFASLLESDGYRLRSADAGVSRALLETAHVFVIANAIKGGDDASWTLPISSAFTADEIAVLAAWVERGGSLLLIADHMPFPGATAELAEAFGIIFHNGFAMKSPQDGGMLSFARSSGSLADHAITRGRIDSERVPSVTSFTGQAFRSVAPIQPLMYMPAHWQVLLPKEAWEFPADTPAVSANGLVQGAVLRHGAGRVAVFGEAAMFTAQKSVQGGEVRYVGMNHPQATHNFQFVLNVLHWLTGLLD